jgi:NADPH2:quinone reductase
MRAAVVTEAGVQVRDVPEPRPTAQQILVRVRASGLNRADLAVAAGHSHGSIGGAGTVVGMEFAGEVVEVGSEVPSSGAKPGDRVMCSGAAGYAEYAVADWGRVSPVPDSNMGWEQAATLPIALQTMHDAVVTERAPRGRRERADPGRVFRRRPDGHADRQADGREAGARQFHQRERRARLGEFGCDVAVDTGDPAWPDRVLEATGGRGVELIVDQVSAAVANGNLRACAILGRIVNVGRLGGAKGEFDFDLHAMRRISYIGVTFRTRSLDEVREINRRMRADLWGAVEAGKLRLPLDRTFPLEDAAAALEHMKANRHFGKVVLVT